MPFQVRLEADGASGHKHTNRGGRITMVLLWYYYGITTELCGDDGDDGSTVTPVA